MPKRLSYANVASTLALFLAVAGGTTAVALSGRNSIDADDIQQGAVAGREVKNSSLFAKDLGKGAAGTSEIQGSAVTGGKIKDATVWSRELGAGAVTASDIHDGAVDGSSVADGTLGGADVADTSLTGADVLNRSIGEPDLAAVPAARVTSDNFPVPDGIGVPVVFDSDTAPGTYDPLNMWRPATPARLVAPVGGMYIATGGVSWDIDDSAAAGGLFDIGQRQIDLETTRAQDWREVDDAKRSTSWEQQQVITGVVNLEAGDEVRMSVTQQNEDASTVEVYNVDLALSWIGPSPGPVATP